MTLHTDSPNRSGKPTRAKVAQVIELLKPEFGERLSTGAAIREQHGSGEAWFQNLAPDAVVWPLSTAEVSRILATCHRYGVPVIPFGAGTSLEGHVSAPEGGITVDLSRMDRVLAVHAEDFDCVVQAGVTRSTPGCATPDCSFPSTRAPTRPWAA